MAEQSGTWWIWRVFWILLFVTAFEVLLGILKVFQMYFQGSFNVF